MEQSACTSCPNSDRTPRPVTAENLPTEMLWDIFSYVGLKDLVSVCCVCSRWKDVGNGVPMMTRQVYIITPDQTPSEITRTFESIPNLRNVKIYYSSPENVETALMGLLQLCTDIHDIEIHVSIKVDPDLLQGIVKKFPNLKSLAVPLLSRAPKLINQIGACLELQKLVLYQRESVIDLKPIADGCPQLNYLDIRYCIYKSDDFIYFLRRKKLVLQSLVFTPMLSSPNTACPPNKAFPLSECTRLEYIGCLYFSQPTMPLGAFLDEISSLSWLKRLYLGLPKNITQEEAIKLSKCSFASTLTALNLYVTGDLTQDFSRTVVSGLPNVEKLCVAIGSTPCEREGLRNLLEMKKLQHLEILRWPLHGPLFDMLLKCKQIKHLVISFCNELKDMEALHLVEEMKPRYLKITKCVSLTDIFLKSFPLCETLEELHVELKDPLEQTVRDLKLRQPSTRITVRKIYESVV